MIVLGHRITKTIDIFEFRKMLEKFLRIILDIRAHNISVVTFYVIEKNQLPVIK